MFSTGHFAAVAAIPAPSTPLGPFEPSAVSWTTWVTLMGFVGLTTMALITASPAVQQALPAAPAARRSLLVDRATARLSMAAIVLGALVVPAVLSDMADGATTEGSYDYVAAINSLYDGSLAGLWSGLEVTLIFVAFLLLVPVALRPVNSACARSRFLGAGLAAGAVALVLTKFPADMSAGTDRTILETGIWILHLIGAAVWIGGLAGLLLLAVPGVVPAADRGAFWSALIRRFSAVAMSCVAVITLSGLFLYWEHVDGPKQLFTTMYGKTLGVKLLIFGTLLLLGMANQFWLHPRIEALRAAGDHRSVAAIVLRHFPALVAVELVLGMSVLFIAPFLHGSARNQAYQASIAQQITKPTSADKLPKLPQQRIIVSDWVLGTGETVAVVAVMVVGYGMSGRILRARRTTSVPAMAGAGRNHLTG